MLYIENIKCLTNIIQSGNALRKIYFHLFCFWEFARKKKMFQSMYTLLEGSLMCKYIPLSSLYLMYMHYLNGQNTFLWNGRRVITESIMKKKTWKFHIILRLITKLVKIFEIYKCGNEWIYEIRNWKLQTINVKKSIFRCKK